MRQSNKITRYAIGALIVSLLLLFTTPVMAGSSSIPESGGVPAPQEISLVSSPVSTTTTNPLAVKTVASRNKTRQSRHQRRPRSHPQYPSAHALSSEYGNGDGFLYHHLACGGVYEPSDMGVAHKYLPCGTQLRLCYPAEHPQHCVHVTVLDRGPYSGEREFDLQIRPAAALGFSGVGSVSWEVLKSHRHGRR